VEARNLRHPSRIDQRPRPDRVNGEGEVLLFRWWCGLDAEQMNLLAVTPEPRSGEPQVRALDFLHAQHANVEPDRCVDVLVDACRLKAGPLVPERDMR